MQGDFKRDIWFVDQIYVRRQVSEKNFMKVKNVCRAFIDLKNAHNRMNKNTI